MKFWFIWDTNTYIKQKETAAVLCIQAVAINPWKRRQGGKYFEKRDERKTAGVRKRQTHLIHLHGSDFIQEMGFFVSGRSSSILVTPSSLVISIFLTPPAPPFTWMNYCALNWGCLFPVTEKNTLESRREEDDCERAAGCLLEWWCQS